MYQLKEEGGELSYLILFIQKLAYFMKYHLINSAPALQQVGRMGGD